MKSAKNKKIYKRSVRHARIRSRISGTTEKPRLSVYRSNKFIYAQIIDDTKGVTLASASDVSLEGKKTKAERSVEVGNNIAKAALSKGVKKVVFDRGGFIFTGRIKALAEAARKGGLEF
ncbi:MAG: 50S ribosomal protein L18 [Candidatus Paceibacterota bacterium]|jgi:large subunit ribosomal protein L18